MSITITPWASENLIAFDSKCRTICYTRVLSMKSYSHTLIFSLVKMLMDLRDAWPCMISEHSLTTESRFSLLSYGCYMSFSVKLLSRSDFTWMSRSFPAFNMTVTYSCISSLDISSFCLMFWPTATTQLIGVSSYRDTELVNKLSTLLFFLVSAKL